MVERMDNSPLNSAYHGCGLGFSWVAFAGAGHLLDRSCKLLAERLTAATQRSLRMQPVSHLTGKETWHATRLPPWARSHRYPDCTGRVHRPRIVKDGVDL